MIVGDFAAGEHVQDGRITDAGMEELRRRLPHVRFDTLDQSRDMKDFIKVFTVDTLVRFVQARLDALGDVESHHYFDRYEPRTHNEWTGMGEPATEFKIGAKVLHTRNVRARGASQELASQELANGTMGIVIGFQQIGDISWPKCE